MRRKRLGGLYLLWLIVLSACSQNVQDNDYTPDDKAAEINLQLGIEYMRRGRTDIALKRLNKALSIDRNYAQAHNAIAVLYERLGLSDEAKRHYQQAIELKPTDSDIYNNYGQFLCKQKQWQEANQAFLKALENPVYQTPEIPYTNAGLCALHHDDFSQAETYFRKALQLNPKFARALYQMAHLNYEQNNYRVAQDYLTRYSEIAKHTPETLWLGIRIERAFGNQEAQANYAHLLRRQFPDAVQTQLLNQLEKP